jgi:hypothetical protein
MVHGHGSALEIVIQSTEPDSFFASCSCCIFIGGFREQLVRRTADFGVCELILISTHVQSSTRLDATGLFELKSTALSLNFSSPGTGLSL